MFSLPIKLNTSFIKSLKPKREHKQWYTCYSRIYSHSINLCRTPRLPWSFKFKVEVSFPLSSFRTTSYTPASFLEIWQRKEKPDSAVKTTTDDQYNFDIHLKRQAFSSSKGAAETHIWRKSKKADGQTTGRLKQKHSQAKRQNQMWPLAGDDNRKLSPDFYSSPDYAVGIVCCVCWGAALKWDTCDIMFIYRGSGYLRGRYVTESHTDRCLETIQASGWTLRRRMEKRVRCEMRED